MINKSKFEKLANSQIIIIIIIITIIIISSTQTTKKATSQLRYICRKNGPQKTTKMYFTAILRAILFNEGLKENDGYLGQILQYLIQTKDWLSLNDTQEMLVFWVRDTRNKWTNKWQRFSDSNRNAKYWKARRPLPNYIAEIWYLKVRRSQHHSINVNIRRQNECWIN